MPRSKTVARNRTFPAVNPDWPAARKAQQRRTVFKKMAKLRLSKATRAPDGAGEAAEAAP